MVEIWNVYESGMIILALNYHGNTFQFEFTDLDKTRRFY